MEEGDEERKEQAGRISQLKKWQEKKAADRKIRKKTIRRKQITTETNRENTTDRAKILKKLYTEIGCSGNDTQEPDPQNQYIRRKRTKQQWKTTDRKVTIQTAEGSYAARLVGG